MKNKITKEIEYMKYVLGYKRGVVISEQPIKKTSLSEQNNDEKPSSGCSGNCEDGIGTFRYTDKDEYTGQWKDGKRNGQGTDTTVFDDNSVYVETGEWKDGRLFNGYLTYIFDDGTGVYYEVINGKPGDRKNGKPPELNKPPEQNKETEQNNDQSTTGECDGNCKDGTGTYKDKDRVYTGVFKDGDLFNGIITFTSQDGANKYSEVKDGVQGELKDGEPPKQDNATVQNNSGDCEQPTEPTHRYKNDRNYRYAKSGDCWWAKNITNNKWFNLTELVKTKPKVQSSIDKLNDGTDLIKL
jgi:hypothetical protein